MPANGRWTMGQRDHGVMSNAPLAERMRPKRLEGIVGQSHILGPNGALTPMLSMGRLPSLLFWGPPGVGKTTLARALAHEVDMPFSSLSAVSAGVKDIRQVIQLADGDAMFHPKGRVLFIDEIHRFSKSQQDALLAAVEKGVITLIGATTENPSFEVNDALLSRCQLFVLKPLEGDDIKQLGELALREDQVMQASGIEKVDWEAMQAYTGGDARRFLNLLENLVATASSMQLKGIDQAFVDHHAPNVSRHYDRAGDQHFDMASALIKSIRGSDPQASLYWTSRMLLGGEKPEFIARRLVIAATEDIGLANTQALIQANACWQAVERLGMPEARIPLSQCVIYLACSAKSHASYRAIDKAMESAQRHGDLPVPLHLRNASNRVMKDLGHGKGYLYPHDDPSHFVQQSYWPENLPHETYYQPADNPSEAKIAEWLSDRWPSIE